MSGDVDSAELRRVIDRVENLYRAGLMKCVVMREALDRYDDAVRRFGGDSATVETLRLELKQLVDRLMELASGFAEE